VVVDMFRSMAFQGPAVGDLRAVVVPGERRVHSLPGNEQSGNTTLIVVATP
jgi:hypothetical protein